MRAPEKNPLTPRETAQRMLEHMHDDVSYEDIIRQLRVLQDIENTLNDVEMAGFPADHAVEEARVELDSASEDEPVPFSPPSASVVLSSRPNMEWQMLSNQPGRSDDALLRSARWHA